MKRLLLIALVLISLTSCVCGGNARYAYVIPEKYGANLYCDLNERQKTVFLKDEYGFNDTTIGLILQKAIRIGMTRNQVRYSQGSPDHVNTTKTKWGTHEQWVYQNPHKYLYFDNEKLTGWQDID